MPPDEKNPELHPDAAGWALGALDLDDAAAFETHLQDCAECQATVAEFEEMARALKSAAPAVEPPPDLEFKTLAAVQLAVIEAKGETAAKACQPTVMMAVPKQEVPTVASVRQAVTEAKVPEGSAGPPPSRMSRWWHWHWNFPVFSLAAALGAAAAATVVVLANIGQSAAPDLVSGTGPSVVTPLHATTAAKTFHVGGATGQATARQAGESWTFELKVHGLRPLPGNGFYECWWSGRGSSPTHPELVSGGTFVVGKSGSATLTMTTGVDPRQFRGMKITAEQPGSGQLHGPTVLVGRSLT
jgi:Anti-sigma-K factor rskA/Putative zinc-finger